MFQSWNNICLNNNRSNFTQAITNIVRLETAMGSIHLHATMCCLNVYHLLFNIQFSSDLVSVGVAPPSHINTSSIIVHISKCSCVTNALSERSMIIFMVDSDMTISSSVSPPFRVDDFNSYGISLVVSGENDPS